MNRTDYITRQLERTRTKRFENYVITRFWHKLDDLSVKIVTQQCITTPTGRALSDLFFPQLGVHVEIDEDHHLNQHVQDLAREKDIINATDHEIWRIKVYDKSVEGINKWVDDLVADLKKRIEQEITAGRYVPWDIDAEFNPDTYIKKGYIDASESVAFRHIYEACNCFGHNYEGFQRGFAPHGCDRNYQLWFPSLYPHDEWDNSTAPDESLIYETPRTPIKFEDAIIHNQEEYLEWFIKDEKQLKRRIVFAYAKDNLGGKLYRFKGVYQMDEALSREKKTHLVYRKLDGVDGRRVKTYPKPAKAGEG